MLILNNVKLVYRSVVQLLHEVTLKVGDSQIVTILGPNGAGKTVTLNTISGMIYSEIGDVSLSGSIEFDGRRIDRKLPEEIVAMGIIQVMEGHRVLDDLTVHENLLIGAHMCRRRSEIKERLNLVYEEYFPELRGLQKKRAGYLSGGEQQMLVIARAMMVRPKIMLLDEISFGLAPMLILRIFEIVARINAESKTSILLAEQNVRASFSISAYIYLIENGKVVLEGSAEELKNDGRIRQFYLGLSKSAQRKSYRKRQT